MFTLGGGTEHGDVGHNDDVILGADRLLLAEHVHALRIKAERAIGILDNVLLGPGLAAREKKVQGGRLVAALPLLHA